MPRIRIQFASKFLPTHIMHLLRPRLLYCKGFTCVYEVVLVSKYPEKIRVKLRWALKLLYKYADWVRIPRRVMLHARPA